MGDNVSCFFCLTKTTVVKMAEWKLKKEKKNNNKNKINYSTQNYRIAWDFQGLEMGDSFLPM